MGKSQKTFDLQQAGVTLHGMDDAENALNRLTAAGMILQLQNGLLHQAESFLRLKQKILQDDITLDFHYEFLITETATEPLSLCMLILRPFSPPVSLAAMTIPSRKKVWNASWTLRNPMWPSPPFSTRKA